VIDRLLALDTEELDLEQSVGGAHGAVCQPGQEAACERMEDLVYVLPEQSRIERR